MLLPEKPYKGGRRLKVQPRLPNGFISATILDAQCQVSVVSQVTALTMKNPPKVMGIGDVAEMLKVSRQYINRLVQEGRLRCQPTSAGKIFLEKDVLAFKKDREKRAKRDPRIKKGL